MAWLQFTFSLAVLCFFVVAQNITLGRICNPNANHLDPATHHWVSDCDSKTFCDGGICHPKRCRTHELDTGYSPDEFLPPLCPQGEFCPDAESECQPVRGVGGLCELSRDDQCAPPPNGQQLRSSLNNDGAICVNFQCMYANVSLGQLCVIDTTLYLALSSTGRQLSNTVYRDNCMAPGLYCDPQYMTCAYKKPNGETCKRDSECSSYNCGVRGVCEVPPETPVQLSPLAYSLISTLLIFGIVSTIISLYFIHSRQRAKRQREFRKYFKEQTTFRNSIISLHSTARLHQSASVSHQPSPVAFDSLFPVPHSPRQFSMRPPALRVQPSSNSGSSYTLTLR